MKERKQLTLAEKWAKDSEMLESGECSLFGLAMEKKPRETPQQPASAISPETDKLLSGLKKKR